MAKIAVIDWSGVAHRAWHTLASKAGWTFPTELEEGRTRIAKYIAALHSAIGWDKAYIAVDRKKDGEYWREQLFRDWYARSVKYGAVGNVRMICIDGVWWMRDEEMNAVKVTKKWLGKREIEAPLEGESYPELDALIPTYKGNRKGGIWKYETPEDEVRKMWGGMADAVAPLVNAQVIRIPGFEADDISASLVMHPGRTNEIILVSGDRDWQQLCIQPSVKMFYLYDGSWVEKEADELKAELREKVYCGDSGDNIPCVISADGKRCTPGEYAKGFEADPASLEKNKALIVLKKNIEMSELSAAIKAAKKIETTWNALGVTDYELNWLRERAAVEQLTKMWSEGSLVPVEI